MKEVYVITGGNGGMAEALELIVGKDYDLLLTFRSQEKADAHLAKLAEQGIEAEGYVCAVEDREQVKALAEHAKAKGPVKAVVHTAGVSPSLAPGGGYEIMKTNVLGTINVVEEFYDVVTEGGSVLTLSSTGGHSYKDLFPKEPADIKLIDDYTDPDHIDKLFKLAQETTVKFGGAVSEDWMCYCISKYFVIRYTARNAFRYYRNKGVRINSVSPGNFATRMGLIEKENTEGEGQQLLAAIHRFGEPNEIAQVMAFMTSDLASDVTGEDWLVDGGAMVGLTMAQIQ